MFCLEPVGRNKRSSEYKQSTIDKIGVMLVQTNPVHTPASMAYELNESIKYVKSILYDTPHLHQLNDNRWKIGGAIYNAIVECVESGLTPEETCEYLGAPSKIFKSKICETPELAFLFKIPYREKKEKKSIEKAERKSKYTTQEILSRVWLKRGILADLKIAPCIPKRYIAIKNNITRDVLDNVISVDAELREANRIWEENRVKHPISFKFSKSSIRKIQEQKIDIDIEEQKESTMEIEVAEQQPVVRAMFQQSFYDTLICELSHDPRKTIEQIYKDTGYTYAQIKQACLENEEVKRAHEIWKKRYNASISERVKNYHAKRKEEKHRLEMEQLSLEVEKEYKELEALIDDEPSNVDINTQILLNQEKILNELRELREEVRYIRNVYK